MRDGSSKVITSVKDGETTDPRTGMRMRCHVHRSPCASMLRRYGVSRASRTGSVSASQTRSRLAPRTAVEPVETVKIVMFGGHRGVVRRRSEAGEAENAVGRSPGLG